MIKKRINSNENILQLSKKHHYGMLFCWKIRQGISLDIEVERIRKYVQYFWINFLKSHFQEEEYYFTSVLNKKTGRAIEEHKNIERQIILLNHISIVNLSQALTGIADMIDNHISFEKNVLFPGLAKALRIEQMEATEREIMAHEFLQFEDDFKDEFWIRK